MEITATIDGKVKVVSEASIRRHLKLEDSDGINTLPNAEIFKQLALMGLDYEAAVRIQEELDELEKQRMAQVHQAAQGFTDAEWDDILDRVIADEDLVQQLQAGEKYSEEDLLRKLVELVN
ncbi:hypothetical protein Tco_1305885 [Tanacetum coccineum]